MLPFVECFAVLIEALTPYKVEVSGLYANDVDGEIFFQIDEKKNEFFFAFYKCGTIEFAFGGQDFTKPHSMSLEELIASLERPKQNDSCCRKPHSSRTTNPF